MEVKFYKNKGGSVEFKGHDFKCDGNDVEATVNACRDALKECIKQLGSCGPAKCNWIIIPAHDPSAGCDIMGEPGIVAWMLESVLNKE